MTRIPSLRELDPARTDAGYWHRLHMRIVAAAAPELARRRARGSVPGLVLEWSRAVVPAALLAAMMAGILLLQDGPDAPADRLTAASGVAVEELIEGAAGDFMEPAVASLETDEDGGTVWLAGGSF